MDIAEIRQANAGFYFFARKTMKFFASQVERIKPYQGDDGNWYFVTSEKKGFRDYSRECKVRKFNPETGNVGNAETVPRSRTFSTAGDASAYMRENY